MHRFNHNYSAISNQYDVAVIKSLHAYFDLIIGWKILHNMFDSIDLVEFFVMRPSFHSLGYQNPVFTQIFKKDSQSNSFTRRLSCLWNSLPPAAREAGSVSNFKRIDKEFSIRYYEWAACDVDES